MKKCIACWLGQYCSQISIIYVIDECVYARALVNNVSVFIYCVYRLGTQLYNTENSITNNDEWQIYHIHLCEHSCSIELPRPNGCCNNHCQQNHTHNKSSLAWMIWNQNTNWGCQWIVPVIGWVVCCQGSTICHWHGKTTWCANSCTTKVAHLRQDWTVH